MSSPETTILTSEPMEDGRVRVTLSNGRTVVVIPMPPSGAYFYGDPK
jgi:hypothetical protein